jgi:triacylglycerol lipase
MRGWTIGGAVLGMALGAAIPAAAIGPALTTSLADLDRAVRCPPAFSGAHEPVLFVHGTAGRAEDHWALGYSKVLPDLGFDVCTVRLPELALGDIQIASEYVVHAVRAIAERSGKKVDVVGYSQGGLEPRWAIRYWLDVQYAVDDVVTLASPHHGAYSPDGLCATGSCHPAVWQMRTGSSFIAALNTGDETPGAIDYTSIYSLDDELVQPATPTPTAALAGGTNILIQDVCAGRSVSHGAEPFDAVAYALALDALSHPGPGDRARVLAEHPDLCTQVYTPGLTPDDGALAQEVVYGNGLEAVGLHAGQTNGEPAPASYVPEPSFFAGLFASLAALTLLARRRGGSVIAVAAIGLATYSAAPASADGPDLETPLEDLDRAIQCPIAFSGAHEPILFVHGTAGRPEDHWALDYQKILPDLGFDVCTVRLPDFALGDIQTASEYIVHAVRTIAAESGKPVDMVGYSQGGLEPRWAVKYWPDARAAVDDIVTLATPHHGTILGDASCAGGTCDPAVWQMRPGANFIASLNAIDETPGAIDYTSIYSIHDELVQPALPVPTAALDGGTAIMIQDVCPGRPVNHGAEPVDAVVFALAMDALTHPGPADPNRVLAEQPDLCAQTYLPGLTPDDGATAEEVVYGNGGETFALGPDTSEEPPLRPYAIPVTLTALAAAVAAVTSRGHRHKLSS